MIETTTSATETATIAAFQRRPAIHFTARDTWLNDPNGLVYHNGTYHLYYQNNPSGNVWGNMSWGHATSTDLCTWFEHPVAITGDDHEDIFSGSIVIDQQNTSGLGTTECPPWVAIYTSAFKGASPHQGTQAQSLAVSRDEGMTWEKYCENPVLTRASENFRDPKVFWYTGPAGSYWVMVAVEAQDQTVLLYRSRNLKDWDPLSEFGPANAVGGEWECPDLFPLPLDGNHGQLKWVLTVNINPGAVAGGSGGQYFIGEFDGVRFTPDQRHQTTASSGISEAAQLSSHDWLDWGRDYYAAVSFSNVPDKRRVMIGWMSNWDYANETPTAPWRSAMSLAREVSLKTIDGRAALIQRPVLPPVDHSEQVYASSAPIRLQGLPVTLSSGFDASTFIIKADFMAGTAKRLGLILSNASANTQESPSHTDLVYDADKGELKLDRTASGNTAFHPLFPSIETCPVAVQDGVLTLEVIVDSCSMEVFAQHGQRSITDLIFPASGHHVISAFAEDGDATLQNVTITRIRQTRE